jgi:hypothetical protein
MTDSQFAALIFVVVFSIVVAIIGIVFQDKLSAGFGAGTDGAPGGDDSDGGGDGGGGD